MDWYSGSGIEDLVVLKDGELQDSWFKWGTNATQCFGSGNKYFSTDLEELNLNGKRSSCCDDEMGASLNTKDHSNGSSIGGDSLEQSAFSQSQPGYQLDDFPRIEQMDDIYLSSLLDDLPVNESFHKSVCVSPRSQSDSTANQSVLTCMVDSESNLSGIHSNESKIYARTDCISMPVAGENGEVACYKPVQKENPPPPPVKALPVEHFSLSEENSSSGYAGEETSLEESILQDLEIVMTQLTEKSRICFRDALYRLANNSKQHLVYESQTDNTLMMEPPPLTTHDETIRHETTSNTIDRAIANLMFAEMESNARNIQLAVPTNSDQEVIQASRQPNYFSTQQEYSSPRYAQVPIHMHRELTICSSSL